MNIALISDENYAFATAITIRSILKYTHDCLIHVVDTGMSVAQSEKITAISPCVSVVSLPVWADEWIGNFCMHGDEHVSRSTYAKLLLHRLLPGIDKVLYVDGDVVAMRDVSLLLNKDLGAGLIGATCNILTMHKERERLRLGSNYFNAGVLLCPLNRWRELDVEKRFLAWYLENISLMRYDDQDIFNGVFAGKVCWIDKRWNVSQFEVLVERPLIPIRLEDCGIVHFNGGHKPWDLNYEHRWGLDKNSLAAARAVIEEFVRGVATVPAGRA